MTIQPDDVRRAPGGRKLTGGVIIFDEAGQILEWSAEALRLHGYDSVEDVRRHLSTFADTFALDATDGTALSYDDWPVCRLMRGEPVDNLELCLRRLDTGQSWFVSYSGIRLSIAGRARPWYVLLLQDVTEWYRTGHALRESETRLRAIVESATAGILTLDEDGTIETANPAMLALFGHPPATLIGRPIGTVMPEFTFDQLRRIAGVNGTRGLESAGRRADGSVFPIDVSISEMRLAGRRHFTAIVRDISARKEAERRLRDNHALLRTLVEGITDPLYVKDAEGRFRYVNAALARRVGRTPDECIGVDPAEIYGREASAAMQAIDRRVLESTRPVTYEETVDLGNGAPPGHFLVTKLAYRDADGRTAGLVGFSRDITSLKRAEHALRRSERHVRDVMDSLPVAIIVLAADGRVRETNAVARDLFAACGIAANAIEGLPWTDLPWTGTPELVASLSAAIRRAARGEMANLANVPAGAARAAFDLTLAPMRDERGGTHHVILSAIDVTERHTAEALAREQQMELAHLERVQTMGHMASGLAHELNQPLGSIVNYAGAARQLLARGEVDATKFDMILKEVVSESSRAGEIIRRLRKFVEKQRPQVQPTDITLLINEALHILAFETRRIGVVADVYFDTDLPMVAADSVQIGQVLVNLIRNAIDAMQEVPRSQRTLRVTAVHDAGGVRVAVADSGVGADDQDLGRLFKAFHTTKPQGLGMGLALCRMIIEGHGGQIWAERAQPSGLSVAFTLRSAAEFEESDERGRTEGVSG